MVLRHGVQGIHGLPRKRTEICRAGHHVCPADQVQQLVEPAGGPTLEGPALHAVGALALHDVVPLVQQPQHLRDELRRMLPIAVHGQHNTSLRRGQTRAQRGLMAEIAAQLDDLYTLIVLRKAPQQCRSCIARAVVYADKREFLRQLVDHGPQSAVGLLKGIRLVVKGQHNIRS